MKWAGVAVVGLTLLVASNAAAQGDFHWRGQLPSGQAIEIKGINGDVRATPSSSGDIEVTATKTSRRSNPAEVRIEMVPHAGGVTICAVYPSTADSEPNRCEPGTGGGSRTGGRSRSGGGTRTRDNDTVVHFDVRVPYGVRFIGRTVNGEINADSLQADVEAHTVNGSVKVTTTGSAVANTVNGSVNVTMGRADWPNDADFKTVNGGITLTLPSVLDAELRADTLNGSIASDFPITVTGELSPRRLHGRIGNGGHDLHLSTVNGSIRLIKGQ